MERTITAGQFAGLLERHFDVIEAHRDLLSRVAPSVRTLDALPPAVQRELELFQRVPGSEVSTFTTGLRDMLQTINEEISKAKPTDGASDEENQEKAQALVTLVETVREGLWQAAGDNINAMRVVAHILAPGFRRHQVMMTSLVTSAVSAFEVTVATLCEYYYRLHPAALGGEEPEFSLQDLQALDRFEDAIEAAIDSRVNSLLFKNVDEWSGWFEKRFKKGFAELVDEWGQTREVFYRRNLFVHNGGRVNRVYLSKVTDSSAKLGAVLAADEKYVEETLRRLLVLGASAIAFVWGKLGEGEPSPASALSMNVYERLMQAGQWQDVEKLCLFAEGNLGELRANERTRHTISFNRMLAQKELYGQESIQQEVSTYDISALGRDFALAKLCLEDEADTALELALSLIQSGELDETAARDWPILTPIRADGRLDDALKALSAHSDDDSFEGL